jgi:serine/threonine protein phosphatase PrpC
LVVVRHSIALKAGNPEFQDRAGIFDCGERTIVAVADGAGGISGGAEAAEMFMRLVRESAAGLQTPADCQELLSRIDSEIDSAAKCGETTGVVLVISEKLIFGASVGDSAAWLFKEKQRDELTAGQQRKPCLGTGMTSPRIFVRPHTPGTLIAASDGLWNYTNMGAIQQHALATPISEVGEKLLELVRLRSGTFADDVAIVACGLDGETC